MAELLRLDHAAFPWLWWNSAAEFAAYAETTGVRLFLGRERGRPIAYVGVTSFPGWGHLDRIAVDPTAQERGLGREALAFAVGALAQAGAGRVALSTQETNVRSQRLYERFGFRRTPDHDYRLYGATLGAPGDEEG
jgi:ribosomal protein S18 acetylase RimI-like enzyme